MAKMNEKVCPYCGQKKKDKRRRSLNQNNLYWLWMTIMGKDIGYDKENMHIVFRKLFIGEKMPTLCKDEFMVYLKNLDKDIPSTRILSVFGFRKYMDKVEQQAIELGIKLPQQGDKFFDSYYGESI